MSDSIDRDAAIDGLAKLVPYAIYDESTESYTNGLTDAYNLICQLPSTQPQWIPCSERLPDDYATVLITHRGGVSFGWYNGRYWERGANAKHRPLQTVIAWMPLPEAYKGEEE